MSSRRCATLRSECSESSPSSGGARARSSCEQQSASLRSESSARRFQGFNALCSRRRSRCRHHPAPLGARPWGRAGVRLWGLGPGRHQDTPPSWEPPSPRLDSVTHGMQPTPEHPRGPVTHGLLRPREQPRGPPSPALTAHPPSLASPRPHSPLTHPYRPHPMCDLVDHMGSQCTQPSSPLDSLPARPCTPLALAPPASLPLPPAPTRSHPPPPLTRCAH